MDEPTAKKSTSLEILVIQNISNVNELKAKLSDIICNGKYYQYDVSSCLKSLMTSSDQEIALLSIQAISELAKCEDKRENYAQKDVIEPILNYLSIDMTVERYELVKQCCRALGNLCCDCDAARKAILKANGVPILVNILDETLREHSFPLEDIKMLACKTLLNYSIGGQEFSECIAEKASIQTLNKVIISELKKEDDMDDDLVTTVLLILSVINDNMPEFLFEPEVNLAVQNVLRETTNVEMSELCLDHLHSQAEHDSVKTLIAKENGVHLVCSRLEQLLRSHERGELQAEDSAVQAVLKQACDLVIIVLTGDEAMHLLYNNGVGEVYLTVVRWLDSPSHHLLTTAVLAVGNFARQDDYCVQMMQDHIFDKLLDIFDVYHGFHVRMTNDPSATHPIDPTTVTKIQHALLSALRNLSVPAANKRAAAARGRAAPRLLAALPALSDHHVAYKLLAALRMLVDGQEAVARQLVLDPAALSAAARWGRAAQCAGAAAEAARLLAWSVRQLRHAAGARRLAQVDGCVSSLVNMLVSCHSVMQNEAILALTLLSIQTLTPPSTPEDFDYEKCFTSELLASEIGKHVSVLIETNCAKLPIEVGENLLAFLDITSKKNEILADFREAKVHDALQKFVDTRKDLSDEFKRCVVGVLTALSDDDKTE